MSRLRLLLLVGCTWAALLPRPLSAQPNPAADGSSSCQEVADFLAQPSPGGPKLPPNGTLYLGSAVRADLLNSEPRYSQFLQSFATLVVPENEAKFGAVHPAQGQYDFKDADAIFAFAAKNGMRVRGHNLISGAMVPAWVRSNHSEPQLMSILVEHITTVMRHFEDAFPATIIAWDVVNEGYSMEHGNHTAADHTPGPFQRQSYTSARPVWAAIGGTFCNGSSNPAWDPLRDYIRVAYKAARLAVPTAALFYNDVLTPGLSDFISGLIAEGMPLDGMGLQAHVGHDYLPTVQKEFVPAIQAYASLGLQVHLTEVCVYVPTKDPAGVCPTNSSVVAAQQKVYAALAAACAQTPACSAFNLWGFTSAASFIPEFAPGYGAGTVLDQKYRVTPAYQGLMQGLAPRLPKPLPPSPAPSVLSPPCS